MDKKLPTEGTFEARLHGALGRAFPWLSEEDIEHQTTFTVQLGTNPITVSAEAGQEGKRVRMDILLKRRDQPLAIMELKKAGMALDAGDLEQGLSYARLVTPQAPLVVVTNGEECCLLETYTGKPWRPVDPSEKALERLMTSASKAATGDLKSAVARLMGTDARIWVKAIRAATSAVVSELCGVWEDPLQPFVANFLLPRNATTKVLDWLNGGQRLVLVEGAPLIGKSNVLRELCQRTTCGEDFVALFVEAEAGRGICHRVADILGAELDWPLREEEARDWLRNLSRTEGPNLVLCIDGSWTMDSAMRSEVTDLISSRFGPGLQLVVAMDETVAARVVLDDTGRKKSAIGRIAKRVRLDALDDDEFEKAVDVLHSLRAKIMDGGKYASEYRLPWVLRALMSNTVADPEYQDGLIAWMAPFMGLELLWHVRELPLDEEMERRLLGVAKAVVFDNQDPNQPQQLVVHASIAFIVRRTTLRHYLESEDVAELVLRGYLRQVDHSFGIDALLVRTPELVASKLALVVAEELPLRAERDAADAARWLIGVAHSLPLGDVVVAQAVLDAVLREGDVPHTLIDSLFEMKPREVIFEPGTRAKIPIPGGKLVDLRFREDGMIEVNMDGRVSYLKSDGGDHELAIEFGGWLILSHLAGIELEMVRNDASTVRIDESLLHDIGMCPMILFRPDQREGIHGIPVHDVPGYGSIVSPDAGIVEPITMSMFKFLSSRRGLAEDWVRKSAGEDSKALLVRMLIALSHLEQLADADSAAFGRRMLDKVVKPAFARLPPLPS